MQHVSVFPLRFPLFFFAVGFLAFCLPAVNAGRAFAQQATCQNIGFDDGTTNGWALLNGVVRDVNLQTVYDAEVNGTFENGHLLTKFGDGNDPKITAEAIPMVAPGSPYSIRLGNVARGTRYDRIRTSFVVTPDNNLFQYKFAVVLQNPNHQHFQQPGFSLKITDARGNAVPCGSYDVTATGTIAGFKQQGDVWYRNWTTGAIDLQRYVGQTLTVEVTAHGCTERSHFGYAYFDAQCSKAEITASAYCPGADSTITLQAPEGFESYAWSNGQTTRSARIRPVLGARYAVTMRPFASLDASCEFQLGYKVDFRETVATKTAVICEGEAYAVGDTLYRTSGTFLRKIQRNALCDSTVRLNLTVRPLPRHAQTVTICSGESFAVGDTAYRTAGTYVARLRRGFQCDSVVTTTVVVEGTVTLSVTPPASLVMGDSVRLEALVQPGSGYTYRWQPAESVSCATCAETWARPVANTLYTVSVENQNQRCLKSAETAVAVRLCRFYAPDVFTPNHDAINDVFFIYGSSCIRQLRELTVYDRWGEVVFHAENIPASDPAFGWDGTYRGASLRPDTYAYKVRVEFLDGNTSRHTGAVSLMR